ncbi:MarR family transcriptional regulator, transcriptional regulator for hemolysin [Phytobacter palmae]|uniref:MarR family transcriptional regulator n=1 Tax=Phytobacter palmae TaxID=1855371 RepID=A0ABU9V4D4_9ENTR|nr:MarR family transcriptional regulator [Escherichia coli]SFE39884.1 MarR family transcriptional regulator, transcriptional regulator for hemolysin [Phytobacter palmae]
MDNRDLTFSHLLYLTAHHWRLAVDRRLRGLGMSQASWLAVAAIARNQTPLSQSELAQELGIENATLVPLINRLVEQQLVQRVLTDQDKRKRLLVATDQGMALYHQVKTVADDLREEILSVISPEEQAQTRRVLEKLLVEVGKK